MGVCVPIAMIVLVLVIMRIVLVGGGHSGLFSEYAQITQPEVTIESRYFRGLYENRRIGPSGAMHRGNSALL